MLLGIAASPYSGFVALRKLKFLNFDARRDVSRNVILPDYRRSLFPALVRIERGVRKAASRSPCVIAAVIGQHYCRCGRLLAHLQPSAKRPIITLLQRSQTCLRYSAAVLSMVRLVGLFPFDLLVEPERAASASARLSSFRSVIAMDLLHIQRAHEICRLPG